MQPEISRPVPGVKDELIAAVAGVLPELPNVRADIVDRFTQGVRALVEIRAQAGWPSGATDHDVAVFVFVDRPREIGERFGAKPVMDPAATEDPLLGRLFFMNRDASTGRGMELPTDNGALMEWLTENGLGDRPIVVAYRATKKMTTRRGGTDDWTRTDPIRSQKPTATIEELIDALDHFHLNQLTPSTCIKGVWQPSRAADYVPGPQPERSIQEAMASAINYWFHGVVRAEVEDKTAIGRIDVRLLKRASNEGSLAYWAIIELKVIKSFANAENGVKPSIVSNSANADAIAKGIEQAWAFRENRHAEEGLLEIFDLRLTKDENILTDKEIAEAFDRCRPNPRYKLRALYGSADDARTAGYTAA